MSLAAVSALPLDRDSHPQQPKTMSSRPWTKRHSASLAVACIGILAAAVTSSAWQTSESSFFDQDASAERLLSEKTVFSGYHKTLFPLDTTDYIGFGCAVIGLMIAAGGGIGGGGMLVPIYILIMRFTPKQAIPLSNVTVLGGALANTILNSYKRHPLADRPLVDWDLILVMEPLTIAGALIGAFLNKVLPEMLLVVMLVLLLSATAYTSLKKALKMYRIETKHMREKGLREDGTKVSELTIIASTGNNGEDEVQDDEDEEAKTQTEADKDIQKPTDSNEPSEQTPFTETQVNPSEQILHQILEEERHVPRKNVNILLIMFVVVLTVNLVKGGGAFRSPLGITCGSSMFWASNVLILVWILAISVYVRSFLVDKFKKKELCNYPYQVGDIRWDGRATIVYPSVCCLAGFFAGMFGIGGGIVKGPLMLAMGVHPAVSSASSACMILFTSFTATTSFIVFGLLVPEYSVLCFLVGFVATMAGQLGLGYIMKKSQRNSYIAFSIGGVVLLSAFMMTALSILSLAEGEHHSSGGICGKRS